MTTYEALKVPYNKRADMEYGYEVCEGGVCAAQGIRATGISAGFRRDPQRKDLALVVADTSCVCAATFTQNRFCAAPVQLSRPRAEKGVARAVILNSGNANAATGDQGLEIALQSAEILADELGCAPEEVLVASTGVIGVPMSIDAFVSGVPEAVRQLGTSAEDAHSAACASMTTDTYPKQSSYTAVLPAHEDGTGSMRVHVGGFAKGSGMIQPNMATMLCVITTDAPVSVEAAQTALKSAVSQTFNKVTVDSDTSTNDSCFMLATGKAQGEQIELHSSRYAAFAYGVRAVCEDLACQIAADGEGATKLITVDVIGAASAEDADIVARAIANSPLVKTAIFGHDANWGRIAMAAGKSGIAFDQYQVDIDLMGVAMCRGGLSVPFDEDEMLKRFEESEISIVVSLGMGDYATRVWTCDLTHDYVTINGDYRT